MVGVGVSAGGGFSVTGGAAGAGCSTVCVTVCGAGASCVTVCGASTVAGSSTGAAGALVRGRGRRRDRLGVGRRTGGLIAAGDGDQHRHDGHQYRRGSGTQDHRGPAVPGQRRDLVAFGQLTLAELELGTRRGAPARWFESGVEVGAVIVAVPLGAVVIDRCDIGNVLGIGPGQRLRRGRRLGRHQRRRSGRRGPGGGQAPSRSCRHRWCRGPRSGHRRWPG